MTWWKIKDTYILSSRNDEIKKNSNFAENILYRHNYYDDNL